jgi:hypothetical protein
MIHSQMIVTEEVLIINICIVASSPVLVLSTSDERHDRSSLAVGGWGLTRGTNGDQRPC